MQRASLFPLPLVLALVACTNTTSVGRAGNGDGGPRPPIDIEAMRIEPAEATITVGRGQSTTVTFRALARLKGAATETDITSRTVFYVPDNYLIGSFPSDGGPTLTTRLPAGNADPPQRGGLLTVQAQAANSHAPLTTVTTTLTVRITDVVLPPPGSPAATPALPTDPGASFQGGEDASLGPTLVYPNDGVLVPPNLGGLEVHFLPGMAPDELYEVSLQSAFTDFRLYTRCWASSSAFVPGSCVQTLGADLMNVLAESNRGGPAVRLKVCGSNSLGAVGRSAEHSIQFAADRVDGAVYYWTTSEPPRIVRFDFGSQSGLAPVIAPSDLPTDSRPATRSSRCVGCHSISRDGRRMAAASGDSTASYLVYLSDLTLPRTTSSNWLTIDGRNTGTAAANRVLLTSFNPDGSEYVAVAPLNDASVPAKSLVFHDGVTGQRKPASDGTLALGFTPTFPDWSPDGSAIAVTGIHGSNTQTIRFQEGGIWVIRRGKTGWELPAVEIVPHVAGKNRYNASFSPDGSFLLYSESIRQTGDSDADVDAYSDPMAQTWAVAPSEGARPVALDKANRPGVADSLVLTDSRAAGLQQKLVAGRLMNTFPRCAPFASTHKNRRLFWFTIASQRRAGLRRYFPNVSMVGDPDTQVLLWMFALDADAVLAGQDGSYPGFFLPFQDMTTSNHMAVWTQKYVSDQTPPGPVPPPPPPAPPPAI